MMLNRNAVDDQTVAYILAAQTCFEDLKQVAAQLGRAAGAGSGRGSAGSSDAGVGRIRLIRTPWTV